MGFFLTHSCRILGRGRRNRKLAVNRHGPQYTRSSVKPSRLKAILWKATTWPQTAQRTAENLACFVSLVARQMPLTLRPLTCVNALSNRWQLLP